MNIHIRWPIAIIKRDRLEEINSAISSFKGFLDSEKRNMESEYRKMIHNAYRGIVCESCKKNVYRGEGVWVHSDGKAYCLEPCWKELKK